MERAANGRRSNHHRKRHAPRHQGRARGDQQSHGAKSAPLPTLRNLPREPHRLIPQGRFRRRTCDKTTRRANHFRFSENVSSPKLKNISLFPNSNQRYIMTIPSRQEGRVMIAMIVGRVAVDAGSADGERHESVRQRRVVLTSRCWRQCTWRQQLLRAQRRQKSRSPGRARYKP